ncbi:hypothetical protein CWS72_05820 [Telmatospirillum siberiense]|uniref:Uncharacterized protein n=2 Tax=Telmatospirillum siberiense TaxID=382514 RepID=A0A2N3PYV7_9PROT|nr:hypothetical protein CWS72_05820 [Telmatospirillum siberiense]
MFVDEAQRQIDAFRASTVRLTLMSVSAPALPAPVLESAVRTAASPYDEVGPLGDGSLGLLSLRSVGPEGAAGVQHRFLLRMQTILAPVARRRDIGTVRFRAVHRWACELGDANDLFNSLFDAPPIVLTIPTAAHASLKLGQRPLRPHAPPPYPWQPSLIRMSERNSRP